MISIKLHQILLLLFLDILVLLVLSELFYNVPQLGLMLCFLLPSSNSCQFKVSMNVIKPSLAFLMSALLIRFATSQLSSY